MNEITLIILVVVGTPIALAGWLIVRAKQAKESIEELTRRLNSVESELLELKRDRDSVPPVAPAPAPQTRIVAPPVVPQRTVAATLAAISQQVRPAVAPPLVSAPPAPPPPEVPTPELPSLELPRPEPSMAYSQRPSTPGVN